MAKKTQDQNPPQNPEEVAQAFLKLWQDKWNETLHKKGWPTDAPPPGLGQMPFFNPFMPMGGMQSPFAPAPQDTTVANLEIRIATLEKRLAALEPKTKKTLIKKAPIKKPVAKNKKKSSPKR